MEAEEEFTGALAALRRRSREELAAFIVSLLCGSPPGVRCYVEAFVAAAEPCRVATIVRREIGALRVGEREYDVRHRRSAEIVARGVEPSPLSIPADSSLPVTEVVVR